MVDNIEVLINRLDPSNWDDLGPQIFDAMVEAGLDPVSIEATLRKAAKATGATIPALKASWRQYLGEGDAPATDKTARRILDLAGDVIFWHTADRSAWATVKIANHLEHYAVRSTDFKLWLTRQFFHAENQPPPSLALQEALAVFGARALFEGEMRETYTRFAAVDGNLYLDMGDPTWRVIVITPDGWRIEDNAKLPIAFRRPSHQLALPEPRRPGDLSALRYLLPLANERDWILTLGWLIGTFQPSGGYPVLLLTGEKGAGKSTIARVLKSLIDPTVGKLRNAPHNPESVAIQARGNYVLAFDNLRSLPGWLSDTLSTLATGGALSKRKLFTDEDEHLMEAKRPLIITGIGLSDLEDDLADRTIRVELCRIADDDRLTDATLDATLKEHQPQILAALLDAAVMALNRHEETRAQLKRLPRMTDWAVWSESAAPAFDLAPDVIKDAFFDGQATFEADLVDSDLVARTIWEMTETWTPGTVEQLTAAGFLAKLEQQAGLTDAKLKPKGWPKSATGLARKLPRLQAALRSVGISLTSTRDGHSKRSLWTLSRTLHSKVE